MKFTAIEDMPRNELEEWLDKILEVIGFRYVHTGASLSETELQLTAMIYKAIVKRFDEEEERDRQNEDKYREL